MKILNYNTFMLVESFTFSDSINEGFAAIKDSDAADKAIEQYKEKHEKAKKAMGDMSASNVIKQCYSILKKGKFSKNELKDIDKMRAGLEYAAVGYWTDTEYSQLVKKWVEFNNEEDSKKKAELKKEIDEINDNAEKTFAKSPERMLEIAYRFADQVKNADEYVKALEAYCKKWDVDMNIESLCK